MTSGHHGSTISGWQQNQRRRRRKENGKKSKRFLLTKQQICTCITLFCTFFLPSLHPCDTKLPNFTRLLYGVGEHNTKVVFFPLLNLDTVLSDSTRENLANICQIKWNWIKSLKFEAVRTRFLSDVFGLLSSKNFATIATWRNDFSSLLSIPLPLALALPWSLSLSLSLSLPWSL